jgi:hypothetical protein
VLISAELSNFASVGVYQAYPSRPPLPEPAPKSVQQAAYLMYAGAAVSLIGGIAGVAAVVNAAPGTIAGVRLPAGSPAVPGEIRHAVSLFLLIGVVISVVVSVALWLWIAWKCKAGRPWARIVCTVLFALSTWSTVTAVAGPAVTWSLLATIAGWLIGLGAIILLWRPSSAYHFRPGPRY